MEPEDVDAADANNEEIRPRVDEIQAGTADLEDWETVRVRLEAYWADVTRVRFHRAAEAAVGGTKSGGDGLGADFRAELVRGVERIAERQ